MFDFKRKLLAVAIGGMLSMGVFAQERGQDKRPPKDNPRVVVQPKGEKPPANNNNNKGEGGGKKDERRGRP